jgi:hypothetical protein
LGGRFQELPNDIEEAFSEGFSTGILDPILNPLNVVYNYLLRNEHIEKNDFRRLFAFSAIYSRSPGATGLLYNTSASGTLTGRWTLRNGVIRTVSGGANVTTPAQPVVQPDSGEGAFLMGPNGEPIFETETVRLSESGTNVYFPYASTEALIGGVAEGQGAQGAK